MTVAVHNVAQLTDAEVRSRFVVRRNELSELVDHLREGDPPRHVLIIGQRGMGKSLLLRRLAVTVADETDLSERWLPVTLPEELYEVNSIGELWLAALNRVATIVDDAELARQHQLLKAEPDLSRLETMALQRLLAAARARGRKVLLLVENLGMLLDEQMSREEGWTLRQALQTENDLLLMATAVTTFAQVDDAGEALHGFFHRVDLHPLDDHDVRTLWRHATGVDLADRAVPIRILTGGNARLITVLGSFSREPDLRTLRHDLELLADEYTPYFKANIELLPRVERKVFVTLADIWDPATAAEIAERARMTSSMVSAILGRLTQRGAVAVVDHAQGKKLYELSERLYNLYHLLRRPESEGRVRALVDILIHLYGPGMLERDVLPEILRPQPEPVSDLDLRIASSLERHIDAAGVWDDMNPTECRARLAMLQSLLESQRVSLGDDDPDTLLTRDLVAYFTGKTGDAQGALELFRQVAADRSRILGPDHPRTLTSRQQVAYYTGETGDAQGALELYRQLAADSERILGADHPDTLRSRHRVAYYTGETGDAQGALELYRQVAADRSRILGPDHPDTLRSRYHVAYYTMVTGDVQRAFENAEQVMRGATLLGEEDPLLQAVRGLRHRLELKLKSNLARPLSRELREALESSDQQAGLKPSSQ